MFLSGMRVQHIYSDNKGKKNKNKFFKSADYSTRVGLEISSWTGNYRKFHGIINTNSQHRIQHTHTQLYSGG